MAHHQQTAAGAELRRAMEIKSEAVSSTLAVLLIEDTASDVRIMRKTLGDAQTKCPLNLRFEVAHVERLSEALDHLAKTKFDLILTDLNLPDSQWANTLITLRREAPALPIVILTGVYEEKFGVETLRLGAQDYLLKEELDARTLPKILQFAIERKQAEAKLLELMNVRSEFISTVSHELRTPLTAIKESVGIVLDGTAGPITAEQEKFLDTAKRNVDRLARLINNVLDFQKLESAGNGVGFNIAEHDLNEVVGETASGFVLVAKNKGLELTMDLSPDIPKIRFSKDQITQVLANLINNALKFTEKGKIIVRTQKGNNSVRVSVEDWGPGIRQEDLSKLFKSFSQITTGHERKTGGSGLGLAISKKIIEGHRGKIDVESVVGQGSTFYFILPIVERRV